jgi:hypothetical protein
MSSFVVDKALAIEFLGNSFSFHNKPFILIFIMGLHLYSITLAFRAPKELALLLDNLLLSSIINLEIRSSIPISLHLYLR